MKFQTNINTLQDGIKKVLKVLPKKMTLPILEELYITTKNNFIKLMAFDFESAIIVELDGNVFETGKTLIDQETIKLINKIKGNDIVTFEDGKITINKKEINYNSSHDPEEYPEIDSLNKCNIHTFTTTEKELTELLSVKYASGVDESRPVFMSVVINKDYIMATDTYRIARKKIPFENNITEEYILSLKSVESFYGLLDLNKKENKKVEMYTSEKNEDKFVMFKTDDVKFFVRRREGKYIDVEAVWAKEFKANVKVSKKELVEEINFASGLSGLKSLYFNQNGSKDEMILKIIPSPKDEKGREVKRNVKNIETKLKCNTEGEFNQFVLRYEFVLDAIKNTQDDDIIFSLTGEYGMVIVNEEDLIMPIK